MGSINLYQKVTMQESLLKKKHTINPDSIYFESNAFQSAGKTFKIIPGAQMEIIS